jgi:hypothetical protein
MNFGIFQRFYDVHLNPHPIRHAEYINLGVLVMKIGKNAGRLGRNDPAASDGRPDRESV